MPDWSLYTLDESQAHSLTSHDVAMVYSDKRDSQSISRWHLHKGDTRKDIRRPRFSFFRFKCQTAVLLATSKRPDNPSGFGALVCLAERPNDVSSGVAGL